MVRGIEHFKQHFSTFKEKYVLIGGTACTVVMEEVGLDFRATKDLDIVLFVEALDGGFVSAFWDFINKGGYQNRQRSTDKAIFYRFYSPRNTSFPSMLELFSRVPDLVKLSDGGQLTPIPTSEETTSLSAILLDNDYYHFTHSGKKVIDGLSVVEASHLIPLKARAWLDLRERKQSGESIDEKDIRKHKNDILRLFQLLSPTARIELPTAIQQDMRKVVNSLKQEPVELKNIGLKQVLFSDILISFQRIYHL
ncbi:MAG: hypothetical protein S4CHLAM2_00200 [Chlamydiales bacterium]|nr:hypothetical protein [Chlamydiales bacterium]